jgi:hypothetical protein
MATAPRLYVTVVSVVREGFTVRRQIRWKGGGRKMTLAQNGAKVKGAGAFALVGKFIH